MMKKMILSNSQSIMKSGHLSLIFIFVHLLLCLSNSQSIIKNLPGFLGDLPFSMETGYVGVGENNEIQFFYYFIESQRDSLHDPLILYLTGGPGTSGLYPLLYQIGPLSFNFERSWKNNITLELNPNSWTKAANIIFLDLPAGVGFSYATTWEASRSSDSILALHTYEFLRKWLVEHSRFLTNPLYISGISYMGILTPIVTLEAYNVCTMLPAIEIRRKLAIKFATKGNERGNLPQLNIKGCLIVSPLTDKFNDFNSRLEFSHRLALISDDIYESTKHTCRGNYVYNDESNTLCSENLQRVDECISGINLSNILEPVCDSVNPDPTCRDANNVFINIWANDKDVQKALHVREGTIGTWEMTNETIHYYLYKNDTECYSYDIFSSIVYHKRLLTKDCQVLIISGDHDMLFPYLGTEKWIASLNLPIESPWNPWFLGNQVAGYEMTYSKNGYSLKYSTIKGAGHAVALYKPEESFAMVDRWLSSQTSLSGSKKYLMHFSYEKMMGATSST